MRRVEIRVLLATLALAVVPGCDSPTGPQPLPSDSRVTIATPMADQLVSADTLSVEAAITVATSPLASVVVAIDSGPSAAMSLAGSDWRAALPIAAVPSGKRILTVTAVYSNGDSAITAVRFRLDRAPVITMSAPLIGTVARPSVTVTATCTDDLPSGCTSMSAFANGPFDALSRTVSGNTLSVTFDLGSFDEQSFAINVQGTDASGLTGTSRTARIVVENSSYLQMIGTVRGTVIEYQGSRVLHVDRNGDSADIRVADLTGSDQSLLRLGLNEVVAGGLGPTSAILCVNYGAGANPKILLWDGGSITPVGPTGGIQVAGHYAKFAITPYGYRRRDLATGTEVLDVPSGPLDASGDITGTGTTLNVQPQMWRIVVYHGSSLLTVDSAPEPAAYVLPYKGWAHSDGIRIAFDRNDSLLTRGIDADTQQVVLATGMTDSLSYDVNGGWIAYQKLDAGNVRQIWTRSPAGVETQRTSLAASSRVVRAGADGSVVFSQMGRMYHLPAGSNTPRLLGGAGISAVEWVDGRFAIFVGRSVFTVAP